MKNKITLTKPELIDFISETVKEIIGDKQKEKILQEQGLFGSLFGSKGTITTYEPEEVSNEVETFTDHVHKSSCSGPNCDTYDVLKLFDDMILSGVDVRKVITLLHNLPNWQKNNPNPHIKDYYEKNPDMVATVPKISSSEIKTLTELLEIIEVPFVNKEQGNVFRGWMNKNHPDWKAIDGDVLDPEGSYNNKWISQAWRQYREEYIKTDFYTPEIPFEVLSSALICLKTWTRLDDLRKQYGFDKSIPKKKSHFGFDNLEQLNNKEMEAILKHIESTLSEQESEPSDPGGMQDDHPYSPSSVLSKNKNMGIASKEEWKKQVEELRKKLKTHDSRVKLAAELDPGFVLATKYQQQSNEPGWGLAYKKMMGTNDSLCSSLGKWLVEIRFTAKDEEQAYHDELDADGDGIIKLMPDASRRCMACHEFLGINARKPNAQERLLMQRSFESMAVMPEKLYNLVVEIKDWFLEGGYHYVIDIVAFVAYLVCPITAGIGCAVSVALDLINAYTYVKYDDDYYMAGMQIAFAVVPGGEMMKYALKNAAAKKAIGNFFRKIWGNGDFGNAIKAAREEFKALGPAAKAELKEVFGGAVKFVKNGLKTIIGGLNKLKNLAKSYLPSSLYSMLKKMVNLLSNTFRALVYAIELFVYDPGMPAQLIELIAGENSFSDWLMKQPKIGLWIWSSALASSGKFKAAITTTPYDCSGKVYVWANMDRKADDDVSIEQSWLGDGYKQEDFDEETVWEEWKGGWRPESNSHVIALYHMIENNEITAPESSDNSALITKYDTYLKDCLTFVQAMDSKDDEDLKELYMLFTELGYTEADIDETFKILGDE